MQIPRIGFFPKVIQHFMSSDLDASAFAKSPSFQKALFLGCSSTQSHSPHQTYPRLQPNDRAYMKNYLFHPAAVLLKCNEGGYDVPKRVLPFPPNHCPLWQPKKTRYKRLVSVIGAIHQHCTNQKYSCSVPYHPRVIPKIGYGDRLVNYNIRHSSLFGASGIILSKENKIS